MDNRTLHVAPRTNHRMCNHNHKPLFIMMFFRASPNTCPLMAGNPCASERMHASDCTGLRTDTPVRIFHCMLFSPDMPQKFSVAQEKAAPRPPMIDTRGYSPAGQSLPTSDNLTL